MSQGFADTKIPQFITQHTTPDTKGIVVVDWSQSAIIRLLATKRYVFLHNGEDVLSIRKVQQLLQDVFYIKESECFQLGVLYCLIYRRNPIPAVISACGSILAQHCYMFAKYFKSRAVCHVDKSGNIVVDPQQLIEFFNAYNKVEEYMMSHV